MVPISEILRSFSILCLAILVSATTFVMPLQEIQGMDEFSSLLAKDIHQVSDDELTDRFNRLILGTQESVRACKDGVLFEVEKCLTEIVRRSNTDADNSRWIGLLERALSLTYDPIPENPNEANIIEEGIYRARFPLHGNDLLVLTALRRVQGVPDPLQVEVEGATRIEAKLSCLPAITVNLVNRDIAWQKYTIAKGNCQRRPTGSEKMLMVELWDEQGKPVDKSDKSYQLLSDLYVFVDQSYGDKIKYRLNLEDYVSITKPGVYTCRIAYHFWFADGNFATGKGYIVHRSKTFEIVVTDD